MAEMQIGWGNCSSSTKNQVNNFVEAVRNILGDNLVGAYLHGSLAMDCFNIHSSDIDILCVVESSLSVEDKQQVAKAAFAHSSNPHSLEFSVLTMGQLHPWQYPTPYDFHFSEDWRDKMLGELDDGTWQTWNDKTPKDGDLAAHIMIVRHEGVVLYGKPIKEIFPYIPDEDYWASIISDFKWLQTRLENNPTYGVLNMCRVYYYKAEKVVCSKLVGGLWALNVLSKEYKDTIQQALDVYKGISPEMDVSANALKRFATHMGNLVLDDED